MISRSALAAFATALFAFTGTALACGPKTLEIVKAMEAAKEPPAFGCGSDFNDLLKRAHAKDWAGALQSYEAHLEGLGRSDAGTPQAVATIAYLKDMAAKTKPAQAALKGVLKAIEIEPNVAGARCGNHYVLLVRLEGRKGKTEKVRVYDVANAPYDKLKTLIGKSVEIETLGGTGVSAIQLAAARPDAPTRLAGLKASKPC